MGEVACVVLHRGVSRSNRKRGKIGEGVRGREGYGETYNGDNAVWLEKRVQVLEEFISEEGDGLSAAGEDIVDDVVILTDTLGFVDKTVGVAYGVFDDGGVVGWKLEVLGGELVDDRVDFDNGGVDAVGDESGGGGADAEAAGIC